MKTILFLCTGNSCRSQIAEGWAQKLKGNSYKFYSAGTKAQGVNPVAIKVMDEVGIDISKHTSKTTDSLPNIRMDYVFTVCSDAHENCPIFPAGKVIHVGFDDPPHLAKGISNENEVLDIYRRVRDEIKEFITTIESYMENEE